METNKTIENLDLIKSIIENKNIPQERKNTQVVIALESLYNEVTKEKKKFTREDMLKEFKLTVDKMYEIAKKKKADYSWNWPFENFETVEKLSITKTANWILVRMTDKITRIVNLLEKENQVKDESIEDTLIDLANYSILLKIYLQNKNR